MAENISLGEVTQSVREEKARRILQEARKLRPECVVEARDDVFYVWRSTGRPVMVYFDLSNLEDVKDEEFGKEDIFGWEERNPNKLISAIVAGRVFPMEDGLRLVQGQGVDRCPSRTHDHLRGTSKQCELSAGHEGDCKAVVTIDEKKAPAPPVASAPCAHARRFPESGACMHCGDIGRREKGTYGVAPIAVKIPQRLCGGCNAPIAVGRYCAYCEHRDESASEREIAAEQGRRDVRYLNERRPAALKAADVAAARAPKPAPKAPWDSEDVDDLYCSF